MSFRGQLLIFVEVLVGLFALGIPLMEGYFFWLGLKDKLELFRRTSFGQKIIRRRIHKSE